MALKESEYTKGWRAGRLRLIGEIREAARKIGNHDIKFLHELNAILMRVEQKAGD